MKTNAIHSEEAYKQALKSSGAYLLIMGASGFDAYLTCPVSFIRADLFSVSLLMHDLEALEVQGCLFPGDLSQISTAAYEAQLEFGEFKPGDKVENGEITDGLWLSPVFSKYNIHDQVLEVLNGRAMRIALKV